MKKIFALLIAALTLIFCCIPAAAYNHTVGETKYDIKTASGVSFSFEGNTTVSASPRGKSTIECLVDGDAANEVTAHNVDGIVLVCNDFIKNKYNENVANSVSPAMADQAVEDIPRYSFVLEYDKNISFDAVYVSLYHEINACVAIPGENAVTVEYSKNGSDWTPVGTDGIHYYRTCDLPDYVMDASEHNGEVVERVIPLAKEVSGKYVRLTFNFMTVPEESVWRYYTNVYEWVGFTELAVASYKSGAEPVMLTKEEAAVADAKIEGDWICKTNDTVYYYSFANDVVEGDVGYIYKEMLASEYEKDGINADYENWEGGFFRVDGASVILTNDKDESRTLTVSLKEGVLTLNDGIETYEFTEYTNTIETSEPESSEPVSDTEDSKAESKTEADETSVNATSFAPVEEQSSSISGVLVAIIIAAVVVVLAVVGVIIFVARKKNK